MKFWGYHEPGALELAREYAAKQLREARQGHDPREEQNREKRAREEQKKNLLAAEHHTVERVIAEFTLRHLQPRTSYRNARDSEVRFDRFVLPAWKGRDIRTITRAEVVALVNKIADRGTPYTANRTLQLLSAMFNYAIDCDLLDRNPAQRVRKPGEEQVRDRVLSDLELALVWHGTDRALGTPWAQHLRLLILTGQRRNEVGRMRWQDVDFTEATWTLGARQTKSRRAHLVPLSPLALDVLNSLTPQCQWAFSTKGAAPIGGHSQAKGRIDAWLAERVERVGHWRVHDLRRTVATGLAKLGVEPHIIGAVLNHAVQGVTAQVYNQYNYAKEKRAALNKWAKHVAAVAERYQPAPSEEELRIEAFRQRILANNKPRTKSGKRRTRRQGDLSNFA